MNEAQTMNKLIVYIPLFFLLLLAACESNKLTSNQNLALLYRKDALYVHPELTITHSTDTVSQLHFKLKADEFLYTRQNTNDVHLTARVMVSYKLLLSYESLVVLDSGSTTLSDRFDIDSKSRSLNGRLNFYPRQGKKYLLEVNITDLNRNQTTVNFLNVVKQDVFVAQNFLLKDASGKEIHFSNVFKENEEVNVSYRNTSQNSFIVKHYKKDFPLALPPFTLATQEPLDARPDSIFSVSAVGGTFNIKLPSKGFYYIQADSSVKQGLALYTFPPAFPSVNKVDQMIGPLRYLTLNEEYNSIIAAAKPKPAVDEFWIGCAGSPDRAKELIKKYYNRVAEANSYFTSYLEGWKTDRGMIYLVFGPPNVVYKTSGMENWIYGEENNIQSLSFTFFKMENPFSDNDYLLDRSAIYKNSWLTAVDIWRQGRIY